MRLTACLRGEDSALFGSRPSEFADGAETNAAQPSVKGLGDCLPAMEVVDLSHAFGPATPLYEGFPPTTFRPIVELEPLGVASHMYCFPGQCSTHFDPPGHLSPGKAWIDAVHARDLVLSLVVIDASGQAGRDADYLLTVADLEAWEAEHGRLPERAFVAMRTDWSLRWPDNERLQNRDPGGITHWPGFSLESVQFLAEDRSVLAIGHETIGTDGGIRTAAGDFRAQRYWHSRGRYQIEMMCNLNSVPPRGGVIFCGVPKPVDGSGFPVRVLACFPSADRQA